MQFLFFFESFEKVPLDHANGDVHVKYKENLYVEFY